MLGCWWTLRARTVQAGVTGTTEGKAAVPPDAQSARCSSLECSASFESRLVPLEASRVPIISPWMRCITPLLALLLQGLILALSLSDLVTFFGEPVLFLNPKLTVLHCTPGMPTRE